MKYKIIVASLLFALVTACSAPAANTPDAVAMQFLNKLGTMDLAGAASLSDENAAKMFTALDGALKGNMDGFKALVMENMGGQSLSAEEAEMAAAMLDGMIGGLVDTMKTQMEEAKQEYAANPPTLVNTEMSADGQSATVTYKAGETDDMKLELSMVNGQWKVNFDMGF